ncbi:MAG: ester cyclase [Actinobacteria bacterium]|nr:MAG: ester cyclase [Actinomycetota bacterium]
MSEEEATNKANERRFFEEVWNKGNFQAADQIVATDYIDHDAITSKTGPEGVREEVSLFRNAFPDLVFAIEDVITEDDKVVTRISATGTHKGDLPGIPATGRRGAITGIVITRYESGKAAEAWVHFDFLGLYRQLGAIPARAGTTTS